MTAARRERLPPDNHVHSEWSWDAPHGSMGLACRRAVALGLPSIAFTEHVDLTARQLARDAVLPDWQRDMVADGVLIPPEFDVDGYLRCLDRCRDRFPGLEILSGVELGEPHRHGVRVAALQRTRFDRVLASVHTLPTDGAGHTTVDAVYGTSPPEPVVRAYLGEVRTLVELFDDFDVLAHIDYAERYWPRVATGLRSADFRDDYLSVLEPLSAKGKALEVNTRVPLSFDILRWWHDLRGEAITFASDAHHPDHVARDFADAAALAEAAGFGPTTDLLGLWTRC